jgi:hypothetical protein
LRGTDQARFERDLSVRRHLDILFASLGLVLAAAFLGLVAAAAFKLGVHLRLVSGINLVALAAFFTVGGVRILRVALVRPQFHRASAAARAGFPPSQWGVSASQLTAEAEAKGAWGGTATLTFARAVAEGSHDLASSIIRSALPETGASATTDKDLCLQVALYLALALHEPVAARRRLDQAMAIPRSWLVRLIERDYDRLAEAAVLLEEGKRDGAAHALNVWRKRFGRSRQTRAVYGWAVTALEHELGRGRATTDSLASRSSPL